MNEQERDSQVSALFDGELDSAQSELVTRRLLKDAALRDSWSRYALIGASLRSEPVSLPLRGRGDLADRVRLEIEREAALDAATAPAAVGPSARPASAWRTLAWGSGLAASVAMLAIVVMRAQAPGAAQTMASNPVSDPVSGTAVPASTPALAAREPAESPAPPSYTTPLDTQPALARPASPLVNYVVAHSEYATPVVRLSPLSSVISGNFDPTENTVEMTAAEVGARR
ncbi:MAG: hypothetical protein RLZZ200_900 [Pseudomonadota bacterium]|jgi:sigma-E factor negative regulatory protein RseA